MKTYFVCSDIHSFYTEGMESLTEAGGDENNTEHILIICGDIFDRGNETKEVYEFLKSLPLERRILIRGNHEFLLRDLVKRKDFYDHDVSNGTLLSLLQLNNFGYSNFDLKYLLYAEPKGLNQIKDCLKKCYTSKITKECLNGIFGDEGVNYYETEHYIFVHSGFPMIGKQGYSPDYDKLEYNLNWRNSTLEEGEEASGGFPVAYYKANCNQTGKTIVCGHWHTSDFGNKLDYMNEPRKQLSTYENNIYKSEQNPDLIGLDACTVLSQKVNILVLDETEL